MNTRRESLLNEDWIPSHQCSLHLQPEILGRIHMAGGMLIHERSVMIVILNAMRLMKL